MKKLKIPKHNLGTIGNLSRTETYGSGPFTTYNLIAYTENENVIDIDELMCIYDQLMAMADGLADPVEPFMYDEDEGCNKIQYKWEKK